MKNVSLMGLLCLLSVSVVACHGTEHDRNGVVGELDRGVISPESLATRKQLAESGKLIMDVSSSYQAAATAASMAEALDIPAAMITGTSLSGPDVAAAVRSNLGIIQPRGGDSLVVLSTGVVSAAPPPEPGTDFAPGGTGGDRVILRIDLNVPTGANRLSFDFNFMSSESPDFIGSEFNDTFTTRIIDADGERQIAFASVNSSFFFDASERRAGGTGFDLFTPDPADVDFEFGLGLPDAGVTDFQSVEVDIANGPVTLEFDIRDLGDGILDSAVIIDNVQISLVEMLDPNPDLIGADGIVTNDLARLAGGGRPIRGVAADGVTQVLLRTKVAGPGQVTFSLAAGIAPEDGGLSALGANDRLGLIVVPAVRTGPGIYHAFALYRSPADFARNGQPADAELAQRDVLFRARYVPEIGDDVQIDRPFKLVRPPLVLVHGIWNNSFSWEPLPITDDPKFSITYANYADANAMNLAENSNVVPDAIRAALENMRATDMAVTQADLVGHSMGGLLARIHIGAPNYHRDVNYNEGDVNRLITMNTPHLGSKIADKTVGYRAILPPLPPEDDPMYKFHALVQLANAKTAIHLGGVDDLTQNNAALDAIAHTPVPSHALYGTGGKNVDFLDSADALKDHAMLHKKLSFQHPDVGGFNIVQKKSYIFGVGSYVFGDLEHDLFSDAISQTGGIVDTATTAFESDATGNCSIFTSIENPAYSARIVELLNSPVDSDLFGEFPATIEIPRAAVPGAASVGGDREMRAEFFVPDGLRIASPASGTTASPGDVISVQVEPLNGFQPEIVFVVGPGGLYSSEATPFMVNFPIPDEAGGVANLYAFAYDADGNEAISDYTVLNVDIAANLVSVRILDRDPILFGIGSKRKLLVLGEYDDGVTRDISSPSIGTVYASSNTSIFDVSSDAQVTATGSGIATFVARNGLVQDSVSVRIVGNKRPIAHAGADQTVACTAPGDSVSVTLDGTSSIDEDGDPLTYVWLDDGAVIATGATPTVALSTGTHTISLVVKDGQDDSAPDDVQILVEACPAGCTPPEGTGVWDWCTPECPCEHGQGDCDADADCASGARCLRDVGVSFGYDDPDLDVCVAGCTDFGVGSSNFCTPECPCDHGEGDCDSDADCAAGLSCLHDMGTSFGYGDKDTDVCIAGCPELNNGEWHTCSPECPCDQGEGDCDSDSECAAGLTCVKDVGANYGFDPEMDVCEPATSLASR